MTDKKVDMTPSGERPRVKSVSEQVMEMVQRMDESIASIGPVLYRKALESALTALVLERDEAIEQLQLAVHQVNRIAAKAGNQCVLNGNLIVDRDKLRAENEGLKTKVEALAKNSVVVIEGVSNTRQWCVQCQRIQSVNDKLVHAPDCIVLTIQSSERRS